MSRLMVNFFEIYCEVVILVVLGLRPFKMSLTNSKFLFDVHSLSYRYLIFSEFSVKSVR